MCGFIAQLVEHHTGIAEVTVSIPIKALIFSGFSFQLLKLKKFTATLPVVVVVVVVVVVFQLTKEEHVLS